MVTILENAKIIEGKYDPYKDFELDKAGYFLIRYLEDGNVEIGHCKGKNEVDLIIKGKSALEICWTLKNEGIDLLPEHWAYLGKEIEKARLAQKLGLKYVQDDELDISSI